MTPRKAKNVLAVTPGGDITMDHILGFYALSSVPDQPVSASKLARHWAAEGLPAGAVPTARKAVNGFQIACRSVETRRKGTNEQTTEIKVDEVLQAPEECVYQITYMVRDRLNRVIDHPKAMRVVFNMEDEAITWEPLDPKADRDDLDTLGQHIKDHFESNSKKVPGARVRAAIRTVMDEVGATSVRKKSGGIYFVPKEGKTYLDALERVLDTLYGEDAELHLIFAANADGEKALIERHFSANVSEEVDSLMAEVADALQNSRRMRSDRVDNIFARRKVLGDHREKYAALLDTTLEEVGVKTNLLDEQLEALLLKRSQDEQ